ncbi:hypothetical protein [Saccharopolyspora sp. 6V]|uniref:hypothetical protein n=1 Tax=Saccharopolyspora sp. 6V TaxID=2877239 RepID=UPI001CD7ECF7|nr:hypothetical protein [Saccharopolyspora sp. 6V]MCA1195296.1 hypothetical protein [Saccharopolyspora sp. 6V]
MVTAIFAAEIAFWVVLAAGLAARYPARRDRLGTLLLRAVPLVDLALVVLVAADLAGGAEPSRAHAFAAVYLGFTVAFGRATIAWADAWFHHRFAGGPRPATPAKGSRAEVVALWREWLRVLLADVIAGVVLLALAAVGGVALPRSLDELAHHPYWSVPPLLGIITAVWFLAGPAFAGTGRPEAAERR